MSIDDINDPTDISTTGHLNLGFSAYQFFATPGSSPRTVIERSFSANSFLTPDVVTPEGKGRGSRQLTIKSNSYVSRVLFKENKAVGVEYIQGNGKNSVIKTVYGKNIILTAGSIQTTAILQRSGIGDSALLNSLGIKVVVDNPNVGVLTNQYGPSAIIAGSTTATPFLQGFVNGSANPPLPAPFNYPNDDTRRIQLLGAEIGPFPDANFPVVPSAVQILAFMLEPKSRGSVNIVSTNPLIQPKVDLNMYSDNSPATPFEINGTDANLL